MGKSGGIGGRRGGGSGRSGGADFAVSGSSATLHKRKPNPRTKLKPLKKGGGPSETSDSFDGLATGSDAPARRRRRKKKKASEGSADKPKKAAAKPRGDKGQPLAPLKRRRRKKKRDEDVGKREAAADLPPPPSPRGRHVDARPRGVSAEREVVDRVTEGGIHERCEVARDILDQLGDLDEGLREEVRRKRGSKPLSDATNKQLQRLHRTLGKRLHVKEPGKHPTVKEYLWWVDQVRGELRAVIAYANSAPRYVVDGRYIGDDRKLAVAQGTALAKLSGIGARQLASVEALVEETEI